MMRLKLCKRSRSKVAFKSWSLTSLLVSSNAGHLYLLMMVDLFSNKGHDIRSTQRDKFMIQGSRLHWSIRTIDCASLSTAPNQLKYN